MQRSVRAGSGRFDYPWSRVAAVKWREHLPDIGVLVCGLLAALWMGRVFWLHPADRIHLNHEFYSYAGRLLEFRAQLAAGYLVPQWCTSFRGGLGSALFCYYQPGFFYAASLVPWCVPAVRALGVTIAGFTLLGYFATYALIRPRFGRLGGWLGASALVLSVYAATDVYIRGDLSEFSAMMLLPAVLWALAGWLEYGHGKYAAWLAMATAAMVLLNPIVGMFGYGLVTAWLAAFLLETRCWRRVGAAAMALALAAGMTAFYWLPVLGQWDLVATENAFVGKYHYANHFVDPLELLGRYRRDAVIPFAIGLPLAAIAGFNVLACVFRRRELTPGQRRLVIYSLLAILGFSWLMTRWSAPVWRLVGPLPHIQFPWRILSVVTVATAVLAGATLPWRSEKVRTMVTALLIAYLWIGSTGYTAYRLDSDRRVPQTVDELARTYFAPDLQDEWLPRGAALDIPESYRTSPVAGPGCWATDFHRDARRLSCQVRTSQATTLTLPHYFFPVGWRATLDGRPAALSADPAGLMLLGLPPRAHGRLGVVFQAPPMLRLGLAVSGASCLLGAAWLAAAAFGIHPFSIRKKAQE